MAKRYKAKIKQVIKEIPLKQIGVWREAQARRLDRSRVREIAKSIRSEGLQNPPLVQKSGKKEYLLISGHHRFSALKLLGAKKARFLVLTRDTSYDLDDAKAASVVENIHRTDMKTRELAQACIFLAERVGKAEAARKLGMSMATFRKYHGFAGVPERIKELVPKIISRDEATRLYGLVVKVDRAIRIAYNMARLDTASRRLYLKVLAQNPKASHQSVLKRMRKIGVKRKITVELSKTNARRLARLADKKDMDAGQLANKVLISYLRK